MGALLALLGCQRLALFQPLAPRPCERIVAAAIEHELAVVEMENVVGYRVENVAVVADDDEGAPPVAQKGLQPQRRLEVEMVGRLVEQQQVRLGEERGGEGDAHPPTAGEGRQRAFLRRGVEAESGEDDPGPRRRRMGIDIEEPRVDFTDTMRVMRLVGLVQERGALEIGGEHHLDRRRVAAGRLLLDGADAQAFLHADLAGIGLQLAEDEMQQCRLAGAVAPDEPDFPAGIDLRAGGLDQGAPADSVGEIGKIQHGARVIA